MAITKFLPFLDRIHESVEPDRLAARSHYHLHFTPPASSWINRIGALSPRHHTQTNPPRDIPQHP
jgi:transposase